MPTTCTVTRGETRIEAEFWGDATQPAALLLAGTSCTRDWWPPTFCERLASTGVRVIRFDQRDTGASSTWPVGAPAYGLTDLAEDAVAILDALGADYAHIVGFSQGGWVAQLLALGHPGRVASLTLVSTRSTEHGPADPDLPDISPQLFDAWSQLAEPDWSNTDDVLNALIEGERVLAGTTFDEDAVREICTAAIARSTDPRTASNHPAMRPSVRWRERLGQISAPTTVLHGTADPLFPVGNAYALVAAIPGARLRPLEGVGHEFPERAWDELIDSIRPSLAPRRYASASQNRESNSIRVCGRISR